MPKFPGNLGGFNIQSMMKQVQKFQDDTEKMEQELADVKIEASSGGGMVTAVVNGLAQLIDIKINSEVVDPNDVEMLQDLVVSAVREGIDRASEHRLKRQQELTAGLGLPPGMGIPGL